MRLPNKVTPYTRSVIVFFPKTLKALERKDLFPKELLELIITNRNDTENFLAALDCLFALGKIELLEDRGVLHYVDGN